MVRVRAKDGIDCNNYQGCEGDTFEVEADNPYRNKDSTVMREKVVKVIGLKEKLIALG